MESLLKINLDGQGKVTLDYNKLRKSALILRAINHDLRQEIITILSEESPLMVTDIYIKLRVEQSVASQHLGILRKAGIVNAKRVGKNVYYQLNPSRIEKINTFVENITEL